MSTINAYIHIGMNKTGTSTLQKYFCDNRDELLKNYQLLYPRTGCIGAHYAISRVLGFTHRPLKEKERLKQLSNLKKKFLEECRTHKPLTIVISSEDFVLNKNRKIVKNFFLDFNIKIIVYLRRHDGWFESAYKQAVKQVTFPPWERGIDSYINFNIKKNKFYGDYRYLLDRWAEIFGEKNIVVRPYENQQNPDGIIADFLLNIGYPNTIVNPKQQNMRINESYDSQTILLLDILKRLRMNKVLREYLCRQIVKLPQPTSNSCLLSPESRIKLIDKYRSDYTYIAKKYLNRSDGRLFYAPEPSLHELWEIQKNPKIIDLLLSLLSHIKKSITR